MLKKNLKLLKKLEKILKCTKNDLKNATIIENTKKILRKKLTILKILTKY